MLLNNIKKKAAKKLLTSIKEMEGTGIEYSNSKDAVITYLESIIKNGLIYDDLKKHLIDEMLISDDNNSLQALVNNFTVGFELETNKTNEVTQSNLSFKTDEHNDTVVVNNIVLKNERDKEYQRLLNSREGVNHLPLNKYTKPYIITSIFTKFLEGNPDSDGTTLKETIETQYEKELVNIFYNICDKTLTLNNIMQALTEGQDSIVAELTKIVNKTITKAELKKTLKLSTDQFKRTQIVPNIDKIFDIKYDSSVKGFEFSTKGAMTVKQFVNAATLIFDPKINHSIDKNCSFHIHVGVVNEKLKYSNAIQSRILHYLFQNINKFPESVLSRMKGMFKPGEPSEHTKYFKRLISTDKYSLVNFNGSFKTWEFRCFGNIDNKKDALQCLLLALRALTYAISKPQVIILPDTSKLSVCVDEAKALSNVELDPKIKARVNQKLKKRA